MIVDSFNIIQWRLHKKSFCTSQFIGWDMSLALQISQQYYHSIQGYNVHCKEKSHGHQAILFKPHQRNFTLQLCIQSNKIIQFKELLVKVICLIIFRHMSCSHQFWPKLSSNKSQECLCLDRYSSQEELTAQELDGITFLILLTTASQCCSQASWEFSRNKGLWGIKWKQLKQCSIT